jgi:hypothetical protein
MSTPLAAALDAVDKYIKTNSGYPQAQTIKARVRAMLRAYGKHWSVDNQRYEVIGVEKLLLGPIVNLTNKKDSGYQAGGKLDVILRDRKTNQTVLMDHKNLASELDDDDIEQLTIDGQPLQYAYLAHLNGLRIDYAVWDVLAKSGHRPYKEKNTVRKATKKLAEVKTHTPAETPEEFEARLFEVYFDSPDKYFARVKIPVLKYNVIRHVNELYDWAQLIGSSIASGKHLRNTESCKQYQRPCKYMGVCSGKSDIDDKAVWTTAKQTHSELDLPPGVDPALVLTNSRLKVFKSCYAKHDMQYNQGLRKVNEPVEEPLYLGSCSHEGLEAYWKTIQNQQRKVG